MHYEEKENAALLGGGILMVIVVVGLVIFAATDLNKSQVQERLVSTRRVEKQVKLTRSISGTPRNSRCKPGENGWEHCKTLVFAFESSPYYRIAKYEFHEGGFQYRAFLKEQSDTVIAKDNGKTLLLFTSKGIKKLPLSVSIPKDFGGGNAEISYIYNCNGIKDDSCGWTHFKCFSHYDVKNDRFEMDYNRTNVSFKDPWPYCDDSDEKPIKWMLTGFWNSSDFARIYRYRNSNGAFQYRACIKDSKNAEIGLRENRVRIRSNGLDKFVPLEVSIPAECGGGMAKLEYIYNYSGRLNRNHPEFEMYSCLDISKGEQNCWGCRYLLTDPYPE